MIMHPGVQADCFIDYGQSAHSTVSVRTALITDFIAEIL